MTFSAYLAGLGLGASLIIAIGAQNAFVLRQAIARSHGMAIAALCVAIDWALIASGAVGFGALVSRFPALMEVAAWGGAAYLLVHGALSFNSAVHPGALVADRGASGSGSTSLGAALSATLAVSLLNPHVYLDTVVLLGSVASQYAAASRLAFVLGAGSASAVWFFGLASLGRVLAPLFARENAWRVLDVAIGVVMWWIAASLIWGQIAR